MAAPIRPAGTKTLGSENWLWVPTIADLSAPTKAELTAASALDVTCYFYTSTARPSVNQNRSQPPARICDTQQYEELGLAQWTGGDLHYAIDPQATAGSDGKKAYEALAEASDGFLVNRMGIAKDTAVDTGQFVIAYPASTGVAVITPEGDGESAEAAVVQGYAITGAPSGLVAVVAGT